MKTEDIERLNEILDAMDALSTKMLLREGYTLEEIEAIGRGEKITHE